MRISDWSSDVCSSDLVQGMMDLMGIKYTHSGLASSVIAIDKQLTKQTLVPHGIPMPGGMMVESQSLYSADPLPRPYVLKPINEGSSVGVAIVTADGNYGVPIGRDVAGPWQEFDHLLAEPRSEEHTSELQSLMRISYAVFCLKNKKISS